MLSMKPHHFMDIMKLYGNGIEVFVPDAAMGHDFHLVANEILVNPLLPLRLTCGADSICAPCLHLGEKRQCMDCLENHYSGLTSKEAWNRRIDQRIFRYAHLQEAEMYSAYELCRHLYDCKERIAAVWREEPAEQCRRRYTAFCQGAARYLRQWQEHGIV